MNIKLDVRLRQSLSDLRWWLFGGSSSGYHCLTWRMSSHAESNAEDMGSMAGLQSYDGAVVDYYVPAFLRKASQSEGEPWPQIPQREGAVMLDSERDRFICVPMNDGTNRITVASSDRRAKDERCW